MLTDARDLTAGTTLESDVCIVGAGPVGLTLARELRQYDLKTVVLESGGLEAEADAQELAAGRTTGDPFPPLGETRARRFGGTASLWDTRWDPVTIGFRGAPLDPIDFAERDWVPHSGWPFDLAHLAPYYRRAHDAAGMGPFVYDPAHWESEDARRIDVPGDSFETSVWLFGARHTFLERYRDELARADRVSVLLHANAVELETSENGAAVTRVRAICLPDKELSVRARVVVLAAGGIESTRLLLLSNRVHAAGIGNAHDLVGRYFMEHQMVRAGILTPRDRTIFDRLALYDERHVRGHPVMGKLRFSEPVMRRERLLNMAVALIPRHQRAHRFKWDSLEAFMEFVEAARRGRLPARPLARAGEVARGIDFVAARLARRATGDRLFRYWEAGPSVVNAGWSALPDKPRRFGKLDVILHTEQAPHPDNRITLGEERDALGARRARLHWEWRETDVDSVRRTQSLLAKEFARSGLGEMEPTECGGRPTLLHPGLHHHMGTTRMHPDPKQGVVDEHCRVHGTDNLYISGASVFPTGGFINPTLTVMALAMRLSDWLREVAVVV